MIRSSTVLGDLSDNKYISRNSEKKYFPLLRLGGHLLLMILWNTHMEIVLGILFLLLEMYLLPDMGHL